MGAEGIINTADEIGDSTSTIYGKPVGGFGDFGMGMVECREGRDLVNIGGIEVDCLRLGKGKPLLVLHGLYGRLPLLPVLGKLAENHEVIAPSLPGFGGSPRSERVLNVTDLAEFCAELREVLAPGCSVVGLSFGAWIAAQMAATVARDIEHLVLVSPIGIKAGGYTDRDYIDLQLVDRDVIFNGCYGDLSRWPDFAAWDELRYFEYARSEEAMSWYAYMPYLHDPQLQHRLRRITADTLILSGEDDTLILNRDIHPAVQRLIGDNARLSIIPGAAHLIEETLPDRLAELIDGFVAATPSHKG